MAIKKEIIITANTKQAETNVKEGFLTQYINNGKTKVRRYN